eukprot:7014454-Alexandrium_andersonii.AAC.1
MLLSVGHKPYDGIVDSADQTVRVLYLSLVPRARPMLHVRPGRAAAEGCKLAVAIEPRLRAVVNLDR